MKYSPTAFLVLLALTLFIHQYETKLVNAATNYSLQLFEGNQPSDGTVGLDQEVRAVVLVNILVDLTIDTDKENYTEGDTITISGEVGTIQEDRPILIRVFAPDGALARVDPVSVNAGGEYTYSFPSGGPLMTIEGVYRVEANYGDFGVGTTFMFQLEDVAAGTTQTSTLQEGEVTFKWINPGGDVAREITVPLLSPREDTFAPDQPGDWIVQAEIIIEGVTIETVRSPLSVPFFVLPESPIGVVAIIAVSMGTLGGFLCFRLRKSTARV